jgi:lipopolysaccharide heptosyltransferase I
MGDVLHTLPAARSLRKAYPNAFIAWLVEEKCQDLLHGNADIDAIITVRLKHWRKRWNLTNFRALTDALGRLRQHKFDYALDFQGLLKTAALSLLCGARTRIGFHASECREPLSAWCMNRRAPRTGAQTHVVEKNLALLAQVGVRDTVREFPLNIPAEAESHIVGYCKSRPELTAQPIVAINPGVGFRSKRWDLKKFAQLADRISAELACNILLTWGPGEEHLVRAIGDGMTRPHWLAPPTSVHQSAALFRRLALLVSCDTGPMHLCSALDVPTVSLFGPTDPARNGPFGANHRVVTKPQPCSFCYKRTCPTENECMREISVDMVFDAVKKNLAAQVQTPAT